jgi:glycosidase
MNNRRQSSPNRFFVLAVLLLILPTAFPSAQGHQDWSYNLGIYEVNVRQYTEAGTFTAFEAHLDRLEEMGVGILWFMPIHPIGQQNRLGGLGSYYSVRDYLDVNPEFGTLDDFRTLVREIHERGMHVIIDWVANHTSWDNPLTIGHPEWYSKDGSGHFIAPPGTNWSDVIELDYSQQGLRDYMIEAMKFWVEDVGVDGFRCDAVSMVPKDFWEKAIDELKVIKPDLFLLAEADGREWHDAGFDMTFGWGLYGFGGGVLKRIADGTNTAANLNTYLTSEKTTYTGGAYRMYFTSNHDENSWQGTTAELFGEAADAFAVLTAACNGMPLIYSGQEAGLDKRLLFFDKDQIVWQDHENADLYSKLLHLKKENRALWNGEKGGLLQRVLTTDNASVFAFVREKEDDKVLVALNLSDQERTVTLNGTSFIGSYRDVLTGDTVTLAAEAALTLPAWGFVVYEASGVNTGLLDGAVPDAFALGQNYPNPFNSVTRIPYSLSAPSEARLTIHDLLGREVQILDRGAKHAGRYETTFAATDLPSGLYIYQLQSGNRMETKRLLLLR